MLLSATTPFPMASSSPPPRTWRYDVFPSFRGEDIRKTFLSHLLEKFRTKSINSFIDNGIERSRLIEPELLQAIRESRILIVIFTKNYASSKWCLNELAEMHECYKEMNQMVIPIFYEVDPSHVRKQTGEFGKVFDVTCKGKSEDEIQRWKKALAKVAGLAGYDSQNWSGEAEAVELMSMDVLNKLLLTPSDDFRDFVGIGAHVEAIMDSKLSLESRGVRMVGIWGPSGIGKTTIARALFSRLSSQFEHRAFVSYNRNIQEKKIADFGVKLSWAKHFLSVILCQNDIKIESLGAVKQRLKHKKVLIVLDDVDEVELLETLVGRTEWFGSGSRVIVVTQNKALVEKHEIDLIYEVEFPSEDLALQMFCQSAFEQTSPPDGFMDLATEVAKLAGNLPLALNVFGSSLKKKNKAYWVEMICKLQNGLNGDIEKTLRICYDGLSGKDDQEIFLYIACLFNGENDKHIINLLQDIVSPSVSISLETLADKSLIRIIGPHRTVQMHSFLQKLGKEIVRAESINNPGKRRFLVNAEDISDVFNDNTGTDNVLGIRLHTPDISEPLFINENPFKGMCNLQVIKFYKDQWWWWGQKTDGRLYLPQGLVYIPRKLRLLHWDDYPASYIPSNFIAELLVELIMRNSKLEKLWEGALPFRSLKKIDLSYSKDLKEIPNLSSATNLDMLSLNDCSSLVMHPSSFQHLHKLTTLFISGCSQLTCFPQLSTSIEKLNLNETTIEEVPSWIENITGLTELWMRGCKKLRKISATIWNLKHLKHADFTDCGGLTSVSDASMVKTREGLQVEEITNHPMDMYPSWSCSKTEFIFCNCFNLDRDAQKFILQSDSRMAVLPGNQVPTYFTQQTCGSSLIVPLRFKACIISRAMTDFLFFSFCANTIKVHWKCNGVTGMCNIDVGSYFYETDHLVVFHFDICPSREINDPPSQLDCNNVELEFELQITNMSSNIFHGKIEGYGVRVLNATPSLDSDNRSSETEYTDQSGESDAETEICKKRMRRTWD